MIARPFAVASARSWTRALLFGVASSLVGAGAAQADQILSIFSDSLTTYQPTAKTGVQDVRPRAWQRLAYPDGSVRAGSPMGQVVHGHPGSDAGWNGRGRGPGGIRLHEGALSIEEVDLALPARGMSGVVIGRTYNARQEYSSAHSDSAGYQGYNWMQSAQPAIVTFTHGSDSTKDMVYMVLGADRYAEFKRSGGGSDVFRGVNGAAGVIYFEAGAANEPDTYTYYDLNGTRTVFFGFDGDAGSAAGQFWKKVDAAGNTMYAGHATTGSSAISSGYSSGKITNLFDGEGREYAFTYSTGLLTKVEVKISSVATGYKVEYGYYSTTVSDQGLAGDLRTVTITTPMTDGGISDVRTKHYRYYTGAFTRHAIDPADADSAFYAATFGDIYDIATFDNEHKYIQRVDKRDSGTVDLDMFYTVTGALTDDGKDYEDMLYDAWGRLIQVESKSGDVVVTYRRNGMDQIITRHDDADEGGLPPDGSDKVYHQAIDEGGHMLAIYRGSDANPKDQVYFHVYGLNGYPSVKCDGTVTVIMVEADKSDDWWEAADSSLETRTYLLTNHRGDVSAAISDAGLLRERVKYSAYGVPSLIMRTDWDADGDVDSGTGAGTDQDQFQTDYYAGSPPARADYNFDGSIDPDDLGDYINDKAGDQGGAYGYRVLSAPGVANRKGFASAEHDRVIAGTLGHSSTFTLRMDLGTSAAYRRHRPPDYIPNSPVPCLGIDCTPWPGPKAPDIDIPNGVGPPITEKCGDHDEDNPWDLRPVDWWISPLLWVWRQLQPPSAGKVIWSAADCQAAALACVTSDPTVSALWAEVVANCGGTPNVQCVLCGSRGAHGEYDCNTRSIRLCRDQVVPSNICRAFAHELVHYRDHCTGQCLPPANVSDCASAVCREKRAVTLSGQCCRNSWYRRNPPAGAPRPWSYENCIKYYTWLSVRASVPGCAGADMSDQTFTGHFNDCSVSFDCAGLGGR